MTPPSMGIMAALMAEEGLEVEGGERGRGLSELECERELNGRRELRARDSC